MLKRMGKPVILGIVVILGIAVAALVPGFTQTQAESKPLATVDSNQEPGWQIIDERPAEGEACLVCRTAVQEGNVIEVLHKGRRFHVDSTMMEAFEADPERYFRLMTARSALFDENAMETPMSEREGHLGWLAFGFYMLFGLLFGALCGYTALARGRGAIPWFFVGLALNIFGFVGLLLSPRLESSSPEPIRGGLTKIPVTRTPLPCSQCSALNHPSAAICGRCGTPLNPAVEPETARV